MEEKNPQTEAVWNIKFEGDVAALFAALAKAQGEMNGAKLDGKNPFFDSTYSTLRSVQEASTPALNNYGIYVGQFPGYDPVLNMATNTIVIGHESGGRMISWAPCPVGKIKGPQDFKSIQTYLRRCSAQGAFSIPSVDDDGNEAQASWAAADSTIKTAKSSGRKPAKKPRVSKSNGKAPTPRDEAKAIFSGHGTPDLGALEAQVAGGKDVAPQDLLLAYSHALAQAKTRQELDAIGGRAGKQFDSGHLDPNQKGSLEDTYLKRRREIEAAGVRL
tara:strand:- start:3979 stop:4800 length:822 start_codon:yes stop_codon:yes gene_type:complete